MKTVALTLLALLLSPAAALSTSSQGNAGLAFTGISTDNTKIAYAKYIEHYGRFTDLESNGYHREYLGTFALDLRTGQEESVSTTFSFTLPGYRNYTHGTGIISGTHEAVSQNFTVSGKTIFFQGQAAIEGPGDPEVIRTYVFSGLDWVLVHVRSWASGEYDEAFHRCSYQGRCTMLVGGAYNE